MSRRKRFWLSLSAAAVALVLVLLIAGVKILSSAWFSNYLKQKIVSVTEESTGGRAELGTFAFDWRHLRARVTGFVLHGKERQPAAPLLRIETIELQLKLLPSLKKTVDLEYLGLDRPAANIIVFPDGTTNIPEPKVPSKSSESALQEIVDLAIHQFDLKGGSVQFDQESIPLQARGRNLRAQLFFNTATSIYRGNVGLSSIVVLEQGRPPVEVSIKIPITIGKNSVSVDSASMTTAESALTLSGSLTNPQHPVVEAHLVAHVSLSEVHRTSGMAPGACTKGQPCFADADVQARVDQQKAILQTAAITLGRSRLNAAGDRDSVHIEAKLAVDELATLFAFPGAPIGDVQMDGQIKAGNDRIDIADMRIHALGANLAIDGSLANYDRFLVRGKLGGLQIADLERRFLNTKPGYEGTIAGGFNASGTIKKPSSIRASARLNIVPEGHGIPMKGRVDADFDGSNNRVRIQSASLSLPHSSLTLRGVLGESVDASFTTTDTGDLYPAIVMAMKAPPREVPLTLNSGTFSLQARAVGPIASPSITAHVEASRFAWEKRSFDRFGADVTASARQVAIQNGSLGSGTLQGTFSGSMGLHDWAIANDQPVHANAQMQNADLRDLLALAGETAIPAEGKLNASLIFNGTAGNPIGNVSVTATDGNVYGELFQSLDLEAELTDRLVRLTRADWIGPAGTIHATGSYSHSRDTMLAGDLRMQAASNSVQIGAIKNATKLRAGIDGTVQLTLAGEAMIRDERGETEFIPVSIAGDARADNLHDQAKNYGSLSAHADTTGSTVSFRADSNLSGSAIHISGKTTLANEYPTSADVSVQNLVVQNLPFELGVPVKGTAAINGHANGTLQNLVATAKLSLTKGEIEGEPVDRLDASASYSAQRVEISSLEATAPAGSVSLNGSFTHPAGQYESGSIEIHLSTGDLRLDRIHAVQSAKPGVSGTGKVTADVACDLKTVKGSREVVPSRLDATLAVTGLNYAGHQAGDAKLIAKTTNGVVNFALDSNVAHSAIHGQGEVRLTGDYPITARFSTGDVRLSNLRPFLNMETLAPDFDGSTEVEGSISGNARALDQIRGEIRIPRLEASARLRGNKGHAPVMAFQNDGPIVAELDRSVLNIHSAHIKGARGSDIAVTGTIGFANQEPVRLTIKANADLGMLQDIDRDFYSSGAVTLDASIHGSLSDPLASGSLELKNASVNMAGVSNGISNANGIIALNGTSASIRNLTAESGGGKVTISGFAAYSGGAFRYSLRANATHVRTRQQGISIVNNAALAFSGNGEKGLISGTVTVTTLGINPQSDIGAMLASAAAPPDNTEATSTFLSNTRLDIRIRTSPDIRFESTFAKNLQAEADLNLLGTVALPGMTGRVTITEGNLVFFGNEYTINRGAISFYNTLRIDPQLNVNLETTVKSVDVVITLTGPIDNLKLSYRSDPPLQFEEIVALLATGRRPSSDPTIVASQAPPPQQSVGQMGESAIVSQAIASPVSSRLERVFGITALKIDPTFQSGSDLPSAALTLQQRVSGNITFTYTQDYSQANSELVRVEWAISPRFSAVALRDINGIFGIDFFYKRQFR